MRLPKHTGSALLGLAMSLGASAAAAQVVVVVSARSPVAALSSGQVADIFLGKTSRFPDGGQAVPVDQAEGSPVRDEFYNRFAGKAPAQVKAHWAKIIFTGRGHPPEEVSNGVELKKLLSRNPLAIGYLEKSLVDGTVRVLSTD